MDGKTDIVITQNGAQTKLYQNDGAKPGLRVRLRGPKLNPFSFGAKVRVQYVDGSLGPIREIQSGSGYWSQNSPVQVMGIKKNVTHIKIQWPDGSRATEPFKGNNLTVTFSDR